MLVVIYKLYQIIQKYLADTIIHKSGFTSLSNLVLPLPSANKTPSIHWY